MPCMLLEELLARLNILIFTLRNIMGPKYGFAVVGMGEQTGSGSTAPTLPRLPPCLVSRSFYQ